MASCANYSHLNDECELYGLYASKRFYFYKNSLFKVNNVLMNSNSKVIVILSFSLSSGFCFSGRFAEVWIVTQTNGLWNTPIFTFLPILNTLIHIFVFCPVVIVLDIELFVSKSRARCSSVVRAYAHGAMGLRIDSS